MSYYVCVCVYIINYIYSCIIRFINMYLFNSSYLLQTLVPYSFIHTLYASYVDPPNSFSYIFFGCIYSIIWYSYIVLKANSSKCGQVSFGM